VSGYRSALVAQAVRSFRASPEPVFYSESAGAPSVRHHHTSLCHGYRICEEKFFEKKTSGISILESGFLNRNCGIRNLDSVIWNLDSVIWNLDSVIWNLESGIWIVGSGIWNKKLKYAGRNIGSTSREVAPFGEPASRMERAASKTGP